MIEYDCKQGSLDWVNARKGRVTASNFPKIVTRSLQACRSDTMRKYRNALIAEHFVGEAHINFGGTEATERGYALEPKARKYYEFEADCTVRQTGLIYKDETRMISCSPDGLIDDARRGLECKCPQAPKHFENLSDEGLPADYRMQIQASLWICQGGIDSWDWVSWHPDLPAKMERVTPDWECFEAFDKHVSAFVADLVQRRDYLQAKYGLEVMEADEFNGL